MKTFITNITKTLILGAILMGSTAIAGAAYFDLNPSANTGITSINTEGSLGGQNQSISIQNLNPGQSTTIDVFTDYMAAQGTTQPVMDARVRYLTQNNSGSNPFFDFVTTLSASNATSRTDSARVNNLPDEWTIEAISARVVNTQGQGGDVEDANCGNVNYNNNAYGSIFSSQGHYLGTLSNVNNGFCDQGTAIVTYRITNDESETPINTYSWETGSWGACINGVQERNVTCVNDQTGNSVSDNLCGGGEPASTQNCTNNEEFLDVDTDPATNIGLNSVRLNGDLITGGPAESYWFVISSTDSTPECAVTSDDFHLYNPILGSGSNPDFYLNQSGLIEDTQYWYKACASKNGITVSGASVSFTTDSINDENPGNGEDTPYAETRNPHDIDEDSAELNGRVNMNDFDDGIVFYVYGEDLSQIEDIEEYYNEYSQIDEDGDDLQKVMVNNDLDDQGVFPEKVSNLNEDETYYYQICVEYYIDGDEALECGGVKSFTTDDGYTNNDGDIDIDTTSPDDIGTSFAVLCGNLRDDGGDNGIRTNIEIRPASSSSWDGSQFEQRGEGQFCVRVNNLSPNTDYRYRACTDEGVCGNTRNFRTNPINSVSNLNVNTLPPTNVRTTTALLNGRYQGSSAEPTRVWFEWGTTPNLGVQKRVFNRTALGGDFSDSFTGLRSCQTYYYRAVSQNSTGIKYGNTIRFQTSCAGGGGGGSTVVTIQEQVEESEINLESLGLGLSLLRLDIDNQQESLFRDQSVQYNVRWENISRIDLDDIDVKVSVPRGLTVNSISRGRYDAEDHVVIFNIGNLDAGEDGDMTISGILTNGNLGGLVIAEATAAYNNPINDAQENATDYDIDEFVLNTNFGTASVFGLSNITFLGWLTILLGLLIIFLIARWLYLEREELRAQAYANGYRPMGLYGDPRYDYQRGPQALGGQYQEPYQDVSPRNNAQNYPQDGNQPNDGYQPYRPNRG